jgi:zinc transport system substrate-binding protein
MAGSAARIAALLVLLAAAVALAVSCGGGGMDGGRIGVAVSIMPQAEFVERVGGDRVEVTVMVPPGANPHTYEPTPRQIAALSEARVYFKVGSGIEFELAWMDKLAAANRDMMVVDTSRGVELLEEEDGGHGGSEPHVWLSPLNARIMVQNIYEGLAAVDPGSRDFFEKNRDAYIEELDRLDREARNALENVERKQFLSYHPAWGYLARDYGLEQISVEVEGKEPSGGDIARAVGLARELGIKVIFVEPQFNPQSARVVADEIGGRVVYLDPLAKDYADNMRRVLKALVEGME